MPSNPTPSTPNLSGRENVAVWVLLVGAFVMILNETVMGVALPRLMDDLGITPGTGQWLTTGFLLTMAIVIPVTGMLIIRVPTRTLFLAATTLFTLGTLLAATAPGFPQLLAGRVVQASGTAIIMPLLMTTVMTVVPPQIRGKIMGRISIVISVAPALGPTVSGLILQHLEWRWLFLFVLPIAVGVLVLGALKIPNVTETRDAPIDVLSIVLSVFGFGGLVYGLSALGEAAVGGGLLAPWIPLTVGGVALALFLLRQVRLQREDRALLDLRTFRSRTFSLSVILLSVSMMALFGSLILLPIYAQRVLGLDILGTGLLMLPGGLLMGLLGPFVGRWYDAFGPRPLLIPGAGIVALGLWGMTLLSEHSSVWFLLGMHLLMSLGLAGVFTPLFTMSLGSLPEKLFSYGSATISTAQQIAGAAGTAVFITVMTLGSARAAGGGATETAALAAGVHEALLWGAGLSTGAFVLSWFLRPAPAEPAAAGASGPGA
ncbi:DHA2 family efflux MFS transporter permease subunit [Leucobacter sp. M11]|uniref:DHA2 family efflux MFS transporter permease subunit n=1 Tax=Leucobacter sp. M11 TaxID=2993565 RepID=UPI002D80AA48|nr:DHA2 family efflux MFS transporter permease subunit [Leucobacter sp. M11]MEB4613628.1 DHA2 family efflux MFS transporter permease subunit [Leucobacter sp. M11]